MVEGNAMRNAFRSALWLLVRLIVFLRYRIRVNGWEQIRDLQSPVLLLPNHPGFIDPVLILAIFYGAFRPRPMLYEENFRNPVLRLLMKLLLDAVPIPDVNRPSQEARQRTEQAIAAVIEGLRGGENFVLWPSGWMQRDGVERLHGAKALTDILRAVPNAQIGLVRTRGLWGSMFTFVRTGKRPRLLRSFVIVCLLLLANVLFFMPRRRVEITLERLDRAKLPELERDKVNRWFEDWYNAGPLSSPLPPPRPKARST
jgi:hypothetical protein